MLCDHAAFNGRESGPVIPLVILSNFKHVGFYWTDHAYDDDNELGVWIEVNPADFCEIPDADGNYTWSMRF